MNAPVATLIWCPFPNEAEARTVASVLLDEGLIACANLIPGMTSLFVWQGERGEAHEAGAIFKTHPALAEQAMARLEQLHSYQTPAIIALGSSLAAPSTAAWLAGLLEAEVRE